MKKGLFIFSLLLHFGIYAQTSNSIYLSEIMFYPVEPNGEFIELYNTSNDSSINLSKYHIIYSTSSADTIVEFNSGTVLPSKSFALILESDYDSTNGIYFQLITDSTIVLQIDNGKFGSSGMANTSDRNIYLLNEIGDTVDTYTYTANNKLGISDEKIIQNESSSIENWSNSLAEHGTPGFMNSVSPRNYDLAITSLFLVPEEQYVESEIEFVLKISNLGIKDATNFGIKLFVDLNSDSVAQSNELILDVSESLLVTADSIEAKGTKTFLLNGTFNLFADLYFPSDEMEDNNYYSSQILIRPKPNEYNDIVINEIMYMPNGDEPEWIEIFNRTNNKVNLNDWRLADRTSKPLITDSTYFIGSNEYLILTEDETLWNYYEVPSNIVVMSLPSLNNAGDDLKLIDSLGQVIDSVSYSSAWGGSDGYSLERISAELESDDSNNWESSVSKNYATPGSVNSVTKKENDLSITELFSTNSYATMEENFEIEFKVVNIGLTAINNFTIDIYHDVNFDFTPQAEELSKSINGGFLGADDSVSYLELLTNFSEGSNSYIVKLVTNSDDNIENNEMNISFVGIVLNETRGDIVINEIMHSPISPEPEWIEIFNSSSISINLKNYQIADNADTASVLFDDIILNPNEYFVFADDSSFIDVYPNVQKYIITGLPGLNNGGDRVIILDSLNRVIDSLYYLNSWGGTNGKSLERFNSEGSSVDSTNWKSTKQQVGGTPARVNSISTKDYDVALTEIIFTPKIPKYSDEVLLSVKINNVGKQPVEFLLELLEDTNHDSTYIVLRETSELILLNSGDSLIYQFKWKLESIKFEHRFLIKCVLHNDEDSSNNFIENSITPGFAQASIIINEIMYSPINGEPEWIEFYNTTDDSININGFTITDIYTTPKSAEIVTNHFISSKNYLVVSKDSTILDFHSSIASPIITTNFANLNNDIDGIVIKDTFGETIDSVEYKLNWGGSKGFSLERVLASISSADSTNWKSSMDLELSTPGRKNSVTPFENDLALVKITTYPEFPTLDDDVFVDVEVKNIGLKNIDTYSITIHCQMDNEIFTLDEIEYNELSIADSIILKSEHSLKLTDSVKIFVSLQYSLDENKLNNNATITLHPGAKRNAIIINEFVANPKTDEAEWIEVYNNYENEIDISNWFVSDLFTTPKPCRISNAPLILGRNEFLVITNDTSKFNCENVETIEVKFGTLGNIEDGILLYDFNQKIVDSLRYDGDWKIEKGRSLERASVFNNTTDVSNWLPSLSTTGASPGLSNSVLETTQADANAVIINEIMFDPEIDNSEFVELFNSTENDIDIGGWKLIISGKDYFEVSSTFLTLKSKEYFVIASDSSIINYYEFFKDVNFTVLKSSSLSLSNDGESLVIVDHWGNKIDSLFYNPKWHNQNIATTKNKSLERITSKLGSNEVTNWSTSVSKTGATPGEVNSIFAQNNKLDNGISFNPNPFSPDSDGFEDFTIINYSLPYNTAQIRIKIFDDHGRIVRTLVNNKAVANSGSIIFDGLNEDGNPLRIGMYIVYLEAVDINSHASTSYKDVIVVARKL